ncbi:hypothetical protein J416_14313 [Gracilibacillus halophilus YIM-C55.5]|uniref:Protein nucleotidyltransferase YdiU n=1 Tax=Gracilibacillus halophilus YIM-C55.5 TaxID=1308866 RepID=N4W959_9BACI|nr:YdiU family protein [Gracilibacillus halophilus]ENH95774.1 hypothetical protein J416_14313 [Gracilibacillus halophilus YIM-C55.5]
MSADIGWNLAHSYQELPTFFYSKVDPNPVERPEFVLFNHELAEKLGLNQEELKKHPEMLSGNQLPEHASPIAQAYAGHQFAHFTMLGDGRAMLLGEQITPLGERFDIQYKGSGRTPYSRGGDGRAALGPMLREYLISEAMNGLGIPTNRSLSVVTTNESVYREIELPGAILTRVADSHIRVGTFQYARQWGTIEDLQTLADYSMKRHFPHVISESNPYLALLKEVIKNQAQLIAKWQLVGFVHGVMNTDNVTLSGETIDYGPCAFMDTYDRQTVFSSIDVEGRYAYGNQPDIGGWNLARFAESILVLIDEDENQALELAKEAMADYPEVYKQHWLDGMRKKLGMYSKEDEDEVMIGRLLDLMEQHQADYTNTFRALTLDEVDDNKPLFQSNSFKEWQQKWHARLRRQDASSEQVKQLMMQHNPAIIPRNHRVEEALEAAISDGDYTMLEQLLHVLQDPYAYSREQESYTAPPPKTSQPYITYCGT